MVWYDTVIAAHTAVTDAVSHFERLNSDRYFVWQEDGSNGIVGDDRHVEGAVTGTTDLFTKREFDPWKEEFEESMDSIGMAWYLNSVQYEEDTGFIHYEWVWSVI
jgi:hypothetical protein